MITAAQWWLIVLFVLIGHGGIHIAIYNRISSLGLPRKLTKSIVKCFMATTVAIPVILATTDYESLSYLLQNGGEVGSLSMLSVGYGWMCVGAWLVLGVPWLIWRPVFGLEWVDVPRRIEVVDVAASTDQPLPLTAKATLMSKMPLNQLLELSVEQLDLPVVGLPEKLDGYRIAHLSDIHLTGHIHADYTRYAVERSSRWKPDMIALTGDVVDKQPCIDWLDEIFSGARAKDGSYFILGNHDKRVPNPSETRDALVRAGWIDVGGRVIDRQLAEVPSQIIGNEHPWFERPSLPYNNDSFRLLLSHSPDQFWWARQNDVRVMLAGHTHGGQGRLPIAGPVLGPSIHGSRYASGDFYRPPTTMHVTRGLSGVHLMRINCRPELSLITLRAASANS